MTPSGPGRTAVSAFVFGFSLDVPQNGDVAQLGDAAGVQSDSPLSVSPHSFDGKRRKTKDRREHRPVAIALKIREFSIRTQVARPL